MKDLTNTSNELVAQIFADYHQSVFFYIYKKIGKKEDAEDLVQDAYLRLLEYRAMLRPDTVKYFLFTIVRNLVSDYLRHFIKNRKWPLIWRKIISHSVLEMQMPVSLYVTCRSKN